MNIEQVGERFDVLGRCRDAELKPAHLIYLAGRNISPLRIFVFAAERVFYAVKNPCVRILTYALKAKRLSQLT